MSWQLSPPEADQIFTVVRDRCTNTESACQARDGNQTVRRVSKATFREPLYDIPPPRVSIDRVQNDILNSCHVISRACWKVNLCSWKRCNSTKFGGPLCWTLPMDLITSEMQGPPRKCSLLQNPRPLIQGPSSTKCS